MASQPVFPTYQEYQIQQDLAGPKMPEAWTDIPATDDNQETVVTRLAALRARNDNKRYRLVIKECTIIAD